MLPEKSGLTGNRKEHFNIIIWLAIKNKKSNNLFIFGYYMFNKKNTFYFIGNPGN